MKYKFLTGVALCTVSNVMGANALIAQAQGTADIVVTATRREQALQQVPLAVTAIGSQNLEARGVKGLSDIAAGTVPGMMLTPYAGNTSILAIASRGIGLADASQGTTELPVPVYIDGVPLGRGAGLGLELIDPERIEFLRGPQGQLFGRNAEGGAVQIVSKRPKGELGLDASVQLGNYDLHREKLRVDLPEFAGFRIQASAIHAEHDGYTKNEPKGVFSKQADYGLLNSDGFRVAVEWNPTDAIRATYVYDWADTDESQPYLAWVPQARVTPAGVPIVPFSPQPAGKDYPKRTNSPTFNEIFTTKSQGHALTLQYEASDQITLKSITSYRKVSRAGSTTFGDALVVGAVLDAAFNPIGILNSNAQEDLHQSQWYQEVQAIGSWDHFDLTVGGTYYTEKSQHNLRSSFTSVALLNPAAAHVFGGPIDFPGCIGLELCMTSHSEQSSKSKSYGVYAQGTYTPPILDEKLELTAGIRYTDDSKRATRTYIEPAILPPLTETTPSGPLPPTARFDARRWDPAFTVKYNWSPRFNTYVRYATAYRSGGANVRSSRFDSYKEEVNKTWEVGLKAEMLDRRLVINAAAYHEVLKGAQLALPEAPLTNPVLSNTVNLPDPVKINGVELEAFLRLMPGLTLSGTYSYIDAKEYSVIDNPFTAVNDPTRFYQLQAPEHQGSVALDYQTEPFSFGKLAFHADYAFATGFYTSPGALQENTLAPNYKRAQIKTNMLNARVALQDLAVGPAHGEVALWAKNVLKDNSFIYGFDGAGSGAGFGGYVTVPRTYGVEFRITY